MSKVKKKIPFFLSLFSPSQGNSFSDYNKNSFFDPNLQGRNTVKNLKIITNLETAQTDLKATRQKPIPNNTTKMVTTPNPTISKSENRDIK